MKADYFFISIICGLTIANMINEPTFQIIANGLMIMCLLATCLLKQATIVHLKRRLEGK